MAAEDDEARGNPEPAAGVAGAEEGRTPGETRATRRGPVLLVAVALVLAVAAGFALGSQAGTPPAVPSGDQGDPFVLLETALASNMPAYVLIHSAT